MPRTMTYTEELVVRTCWCGVNHAIPSNLHRRAEQEGATMYCPLGHQWVVKQSEAEKLKAELARKTSALDQARARANDLERSNSALRGQVTKAKNEQARLKKRAAAGVCPCCNRTFQNVGRHMKTQHPDYAAEAS